MSNNPELSSKLLNLFVDSQGADIKGDLTSSAFRFSSWIEHQRRAVAKLCNLTHQLEDPDFIYVIETGVPAYYIVTVVDTLQNRVGSFTPELPDTPLHDYMTTPAPRVRRNGILQMAAHVTGGVWQKKLPHLEAAQVISETGWHAPIKNHLTLVAEIWHNT